MAKERTGLETTTFRWRSERSNVRATSTSNLESIDDFQNKMFYAYGPYLKCLYRVGTSDSTMNITINTRIPMPRMDPTALAAGRGSAAEIFLFVSLDKWDFSTFNCFVMTSILLWSSSCDLIIIWFLIRLQGHLHPVNTIIACLHWRFKHDQIDRITFSKILNNFFLKI